MSRFYPPRRGTSAARLTVVALVGMMLASCDSSTLDSAGPIGACFRSDAAAGAVARGGRDLYDVDVFTRFPANPGFPEGIAVKGDRVYVSSNTGGLVAGPPQLGTPSSVFAYSLTTGEQVAEYVIEGQNTAQVAGPGYGVIGMAFDGSGDLFVIDKAPARMLRINTTTGEQTTYATFADLPTCALSSGVPCSEATLDLLPFPNFPAFAPDGTLYVSDLQQSVVWQIPPGGGEARVAFTDRVLDGNLGPDGIQFMADGQTLVLAQSLNPPGVGNPGAGRLYTLQRQADGSLGNLTLLFDGAPTEGPDGFAIGQSGRIYVASFLSNQVLVLSPQGEVVARVGTAGMGANGTEIPFDAPASVAFDGTRILVTNHAVVTRNPLSFAVLDVFVDEPGLPLFYPGLGGTNTEEGPC